MLAPVQADCATNRAEPSVSVVRQKFANRELEGAGHRLELQEGDVPHAAFDARHVRPVKAGSVSQRFLRNATSQPDSPDSVPDLAKEGLGGSGHAPMLDR